MALLRRFAKKGRKFTVLPFREKVKILFPHFWLLLRIPYTLLSMFRVFHAPNPNKCIIGFDDTLHAFNQSHRLKWAEWIKKYGQNGYVYEEATGFSLLEDFWYNAVTYRILNLLGRQGFTILTIAIYLASILSIGYLSSNVILTIIIIPFLLGSPHFVMSQFQFWKSDLLAWSFFLLAFYSIIVKNLILSLVIATLLSMLSFTVLFFFGLISLATYLLGMVPLKYLFICFSIAVIKSALNFYPFLKNFGISNLVEMLGGSGKNITRGSPLGWSIKDFYITFSYIAVVLCFSFFNSQVSTNFMLLLLCPPVVLYVINRGFFRFADWQGFIVLNLAMFTVATVLYGNFYSLIFLFLYAYSSPKIIFGVNIEGYPHLKVIDGSRTKKAFDRLFNEVPEGSRVSLETHNTKKDFHGYRNILSLFRYHAAEHNIELLPGEFTRAFQTEHYLKEYVKLNNSSSEKVIREKCDELGLEYLLVFSKDFADSLRKYGYESVGRISYGELKEILYNCYYLPANDLELFQVSPPPALIEPEVPLNRMPNRITFVAHNNQPYIIKYRYHPCWKGYQNGKSIKVESVTYKLLNYMKISPTEKGEVRLEFKPKFPILK